MSETEFIAGSRATWERLAGSVRTAIERGVTRMGAPELRMLHEDYRRTAADLAYAQTHFPGSRTETYLNSLVGEAHAELYGSSPRSVKGLGAFITRGYPKLVRRYGREVALASALLFGAIALGFLLAHVNYPLARMFIPEALREGVGDRAQQSADIAGMAESIAPLLSAGITVNNIQISLLAFAGGMTFGALTTLALVQNGLLLGALAGVFAKGGQSLFFWSLIIPHGALELPAIALAGASGLVLARALIAPGDLSRGAALRAVSPDAVKLVLGVVPLLVIAGFIEGFFTPTLADPVLKIVFGITVFAALAAYLGLAGRTDHRAAWPITADRAP